jgi:hypothetical protein
MKSFTKRQVSLAPRIGALNETQQKLYRKMRLLGLGIEAPLWTAADEVVF